MLTRPLEENARLGGSVTDAGDSVILRVLARMERGIERLGGPIAGALLVLFGVWAWFDSRELRLWLDELLELRVAAAPTIAQLLSMLQGGIDTNPPLSHLLTRASLAVFGNSDVAARLPAFLGFVTMLVCLYRYCSRWLSRSYGVLAVLAIMCSPVRDYAWNARPYGLLLGLCGLALIFHREAVERRRTVGLLGLAVCTACLPATHWYGTLAIVPFFLVEALKAWERKKIDWALLLALAVPPLISLAALRPIWAPQRKMIAHYWGRGNLLSFNTGYTFLALDPMIYVLALLMITVALTLSSKHPAPVQESRIPSGEALLGAGFLLLPILGAVSTQFVTHAYTARYFLATAIGFALSLCYAVRRFSSFVPGLTVILTVAMGLGFSRELMRVLTHPAEQLTEGAALSSEQGPILFDNEGDYLQVYHYSPELRDRMWVIADPPASLKYRNYDTDDKDMVELAARGGAQAVTLRGAVQRWSQFTLVPRSRDYVWALQCVLESGAKVQVQKGFRSSYPNQGDSNFAFEVSVSPENLGSIMACDPGANR